LGTVVLDFKKNRAWAENLHILMQVGLTMAGCILFCLWIGIELDKWLGSRGVFTTIFILLGIAGGGVTVYRQIDDTMKPTTKKSDEPDDKA
jgi:ATP synthase protein I